MMHLHNIRQGIAFKVVSFIQITAFIFSTFALPVKAYAQSVTELPAPGAMVSLSATYAPVMLRALKVHPDQPLVFDFIVDSGNTHADQAVLKSETQKLIKYFLAALTVPEKDLWVNLSPYEHDRIVPDAFGQTEMGRDLLAQDYILKQLTASLLDPEKDLGREFWSRVHAQVREKFDVTDISADTFNKVWIMPDSAQVYEMNDTAVLGKTRLKVMTEQDYVAMSNQKDMAQDATPEISTRIMREVILPAIEEEVNTGKNFAPLRQVYQTLVLAVWYKNNLKESLLGQVYANQNKIAGVDLADKEQKEKIYQRYIAAYKQGVFNFIKEETDPVTNETLPRKYFSGGNDLSTTNTATRVSRIDPRQLPLNVQTGIGDFSQVTVALTNSKGPIFDRAEDMSTGKVEENLLKATKILSEAAFFKARTELKALADSGVLAEEQLKSVNLKVELADQLHGDVQAVAQDVKDRKKTTPELQAAYQSIVDRIDHAIETGLIVAKTANNGPLMSLRTVNDEKTGVVVSLGAIDVLPLIERLSDYKNTYIAGQRIDQGLSDVREVIQFIQAEKGRVNESVITEDVLNNFQVIAENAYIQLIRQKAVLPGEVVSRVESVLAQEYSGMGWHRAHAGVEAYRPLVSELQEIKDNVNNSIDVRTMAGELHAIAKGKAVVLIAEILRDGVFQNEKMTQYNQKKFALYSAPPGGGKGEVGDRLYGWFGDIVQKFVLFHTREMRKDEVRDETYFFRTKEFLQREISERMFTAAGIKINYLDLMTKLLALNYASAQIIKDADGTKKAAQIINESFEGFSGEFYELFPAATAEDVQQLRKIEIILLTARDMAKHILAGEVLTASINKQAQGLAAATLNDQYVFYTDVDKQLVFAAKSENGVFVPERKEVPGLEAMFHAPKITVLEGGLAWFDAMTQKFGKAFANFFISPYSQEDLDKESVREFSFKAAFARALEIQEGDEKAKTPSSKEYFSQEIEKAGLVGYVKGENDVLTYSLQEQPRIEREADIVKYKTALSIHGRDVGSGKVTGVKDLNNRAAEAALQMQRRGEYSTVVVNSFQSTPSAFYAQMYRLMNDVAYEVFGSVVDMAESGEPVSDDERLKGLNAQGIDITMEELMISDLPIISEIAAFFNNDARAIRSKAVEWVDDLKAKFPGKYEDLTPYALLKGTDQTGKAIPAFELFQVLDENGDLTDTVKPRGLVHYDGDWHSDARIFVFNSKGKVFLQMRGVDRDIESALFAHAVGGHTKIGESALETAVREAREEIGVQAIDLKRLVNLGRNKEEVFGLNHAKNRAFYTTFAYKLTLEEEANFKVDYTDGIDKNGTGWYTLEDFEADLRANPGRHVASFIPAFENEDYLKVLKAFSMDGGSVNSAAKVNQDNNLGGIDLNSASLNITVERTGRGVTVQVDPAEIQRIRAEGVSGFTPVIINIMPVKSILPALGLVSAEAVSAES